MKKILIVVCAALLVGVSAKGQDAASVAMDFSAVQRSPKALGMGGTDAFDAVSSRLVSGKKLFAEAGFASWKASSPSTDLNFDFFSAIGGKVGISAFFSSDKGETYEDFTSLGISAGEFTPKDLRIGLGLAYNLGPVAIGVTGRYLSRSLAEDAKYGAFSADVLASAKLLDDALSLSGGVTGLGGKVKSQSGDAYPLPTALMASADYRLDFGLDFAAQLDYFFSGGGLRAGLGAQYSFKDIAFARLGYSYGGKTFLPSYVSAGLGARVAGIGLDAAMLFGGDVPGTFMIGLNYGF